MALGVEILRLCLLFLNIYDSFKTLKGPRRQSGRALTQRKREMKGCLAIWVVWCFFTLYERFVESFICIFVPFYNEFKSVVMLFFIFARARGAEPIFLYFIRPILKPYTATMDATLEVTRMFGDVIFLLVTAPIKLAADWVGMRMPRGFGEEDISIRVQSRQAARPRSRQPSSSLPPSPPHTPEPILEEHTRDWREYAPFPSAYPPTPIVHSGVSLPPAEPQTPVMDVPFTPSPETDEIVRKDHEWREYAPFPSAYPPTPVTSQAQLQALVGNKFEPQVDLVAEEDEEMDVSEDDFDITMKTPPARRTRKQQRSISPSTTGLTTHHDGSSTSSLRSHPSISTESSVEESGEETLNPTRGRKRRYPKNDVNRNDTVRGLPSALPVASGSGSRRILTAQEIFAEPKSNDEAQEGKRRRVNGPSNKKNTTVNAPPMPTANPNTRIRTTRTTRQTQKQNETQTSELGEIIPMTSSLSFGSAGTTPRPRGTEILMGEIGSSQGFGTGASSRKELAMPVKSTNTSRNSSHSTSRRRPEVAPPAAPIPVAETWSLSSSSRPRGVIRSSSRAINNMGGTL